MMGGQRALSAHEPDSVIAIGLSGAITAGRFYREAVELSEALPAGGYVVNACQDRYRFMLGFAAALIKGRPTLMPSSLTPGTLRQIQLHYADIVCLHDGHQRAEGIPGWLVEEGDDDAELSQHEAPQIDADQVAAIVFTSGSTGEPAPHAKRWGHLCLNGASEAARLGSADHTIVATVPAQHMYGFESSILLTLHGGSRVWRDRPFYPADIEAALAATPHPRMLVTTPFHLSNVVNSGNEMPACDIVLCATAPLSPGLAHTAEALFQSPLFEIYGCTESGQVASRRTTTGPSWQLLPGLEMHAESDGVWVSGGHVEGRVPMTDHITDVGGDHFTLGDRHADMVNIAGKRASLAALSATLRAVPGVEDGCYLLPGAEGASDAGSIQRLAALVVAPSLSDQAILTALRQTIDPAFLPRPLLQIDALPRNDTGKLLANEVQALYRRARGKDPSP